MSNPISERYNPDIKTPEGKKLWGTCQEIGYIKSLGARRIGMKWYTRLKMLEFCRDSWIKRARTETILDYGAIQEAIEEEIYRERARHSPRAVYPA